MSSPREIRSNLEREYRITLSRYERAEMDAEPCVGLKSMDAAHRRIQAEKRVLKEKMEKIDYLIRLQVDPEWTPDHLKPLHERTTRRKGEISKTAYRALAKAEAPMTSRELAHAVAPQVGVDGSDYRMVNKLASNIHTSLKKRLAEGYVEAVSEGPIRWRALHRKRPRPSAPVAYASEPLRRYADCVSEVVQVVAANTLAVRNRASG